jgi:hypothetical protein
MIQIKGMRTGRDERADTIWTTYAFDLHDITMSRIRSAIVTVHGMTPRKLGRGYGAAYIALRDQSRMIAYGSGSRVKHGVVDVHLTRDALTDLHQALGSIFWIEMQGAEVRSIGSEEPRVSLQLYPRKVGMFWNVATHTTEETPQYG